MAKTNKSLGDPEVVAGEGSAFRSALLGSGLLVETEAEGVYVRSAPFAEIVSAVSTLVGRTLADPGAQGYETPPIMHLSTLLRSGYVRSFPNLVGWPHGFAGDDERHGELLRRIDEGLAWSELLEPAEVVMCPSVCHSIYPRCSGRLAAPGRHFELVGWCFRHEPSKDLVRMQAFQMHELVFVGTAEDALAQRDTWIERGQAFLGALGLQSRAVLANDPFFGRTGRMLAESQREAAHKFELVASVEPGGPTAALASANYHADHFGAAFDIETPSGDVAHSACLGFGLERVALALLGTHGLEPARWPAPVRTELWPGESGVA